MDEIRGGPRRKHVWARHSLSPQRGCAAVEIEGARVVGGARSDCVGAAPSMNSHTIMVLSPDTQAPQNMTTLAARQLCGRGTPSPSR